MSGELTCDRSCNPVDGPMEDCSLHGRRPAELWQVIDDIQRQRESAISATAMLESLLHRYEEGFQRHHALLTGRIDAARAAAGPCEAFTGTRTCRDETSGRDPHSPHLATGYCLPCKVHTALDGEAR